MPVSVVIPSYNSAVHLPQAIESVRAQTRPVDEVIVVDDGSTDDTAGVARGLGAICVRRPTNGGPAAARNAGLRAASADIVAFLDADDYWESEHCAETVGLLERHPVAAVAFAGVRKFAGGPEGAGSTTYPPHRAAAPFAEPHDVFWTLIGENIVTQSAAVARRTALIEAGGYDETMRHSEDYDLWLRLALRAPFVASPKVTINYRLHDGQASQSAEQMVRGWWVARAHVRDAVASSRPADVQARLDEALRLAWEADLRWAWRSCDRALLDVVLGQRGAVPGSAALHARWQRRARRFWALWVPVSTLWDRLPQGTKDVLKAPTRALRSSAERRRDDVAYRR